MGQLCASLPFGAFSTGIESGRSPVPEEIQDVYMLLTGYKACSWAEVRPQVIDGSLDPSAVEAQDVAMSCSCCGVASVPTEEEMKRRGLVRDQTS